MKIKSNSRIVEEFFSEFDLNNKYLDTEISYLNSVKKSVIKYLVHDIIMIINTESNVIDNTYLGYQHRHLFK